MPQLERTHQRLLTYSAWHRRDSIVRFLNGDKVLASRLTMIDPDGIFIEAKHPYDRPPVALVETVEISRRLRATDHYPKSVNILYQLGRAANVPVFLVLYLPDYTRANPADRTCPDIVEFYIKEYYPVRSGKWKIYSPEQYAKFLVYLRQNHLKVKRNRQQLPLLFDREALELDDTDLERRWYVHSFEERDFAR